MPYGPPAGGGTVRGTFSATLIGVAGAVSGDFSFLVVDSSVVYITRPTGLEGTSDTTGLSWAAGTLPLEIRPSGVVRPIFSGLRNNSVTAQLAGAAIGTNGAVTFSLHVAATNAFSVTAFTVGNLKGFQGGFCFSYPIL